MNTSTFDYDEISDTLYISFAPGEEATGIELNDHILLRINKQARSVIGMTLFEYSLLAQKTELGPRSFPLNGLMKLSDELREIVLDILRHAPLNNILTISAYTPSIAETIPITMVQSLPMAA